MADNYGGGFAGGFFNMQRQMEESQAQQQLRMVQQQDILLRAQNLKLHMQEQAEKRQADEALKGFFTGMTPEQRQQFEESPADRQAAVLGKYLLPISPKSGLELLQKSKSFNESAQGRQALSAMAGSVSDQASYDAFREEAGRIGYKLPSGVTGEFAKDKSQLEYLAGAGVTQKDKTAQELRFQEAISRANSAGERLQLMQEQLKLRQEQFGYRKQHDAYKDKNAAKKATSAKVIPFGEREKLMQSFVNEHPEFSDLDPVMKQSVLNRLMTRTQGSVASTREEFAREVSGQLDNMVARKELATEYPGWTGGLAEKFGIFGKKVLKPAGDTPSAERGEVPKAAKEAPTQVKEGTTSVSKSGKPIIFRNGRWEYK